MPEKEKRRLTFVFLGRGAGIAEDARKKIHDAMGEHNAELVFDKKALQTLTVQDLTGANYIVLNLAKVSVENFCKKMQELLEDSRNKVPDVVLLGGHSAEGLDATLLLCDNFPGIQVRYTDGENNGYRNIVNFALEKPETWKGLDESGFYTHVDPHAEMYGTH